MKHRKPYKTYTRAFKQEAVRLMETTDRPAAGKVGKNANGRQHAESRASFPGGLKAMKVWIWG